MNDVDPLNERPDPTEGYGNMTFDELHQLVEHSLERRSSGNSDPADPGTEEEYFSLLRVLRKKAPASRGSHAPLPKGLPHSPQQRLNKLREKLERTELFLLTCRSNPSTSKKDIKGAERKWDELVRDIKKLEYDIHFRGAGYRWSGGTESAPPTPSQMVERLRRKIERAFRPVMAVTQYQWESVPPGENPVDAIARSFKEWHQRNPRAAYDEGRIEKARSLKPKRGFTGKRGFDGYFIYAFDYTEKMIMECPFYGNAIFVLGPSLEPERWLQMKKQEIMEHPEATRIPHREGWFDRVKEELGAPRAD